MTRPSLAGDPLLAAISLARTGGGVAGVARLLRDALRQEWGNRARLLTLIDGDATQPSFAGKSRYAVRLAQSQLSDDVGWMLFSHLSLAKPLLGIPAVLRKPYAIFVHGIEAWCPLPASQRELLASASVRIANSAYTAHRVMEAHPDIGAVDVCPLALPPPHATLGTAPPEIVERLDIGPHAALIVGRMAAAERYKGHDELIDVWKDVVSRVPDAKLVVAGSGDDLPRLREKAAQSAPAGSILFTGFVTDATLDQLYRDAAIFALPSRGEGFGLVYLEAMARRLPCIASIHDAAGDVVVDAVTGILVDQDQRAELVDAISTLLLDPARRLRLGEAGYRRLHDHFTPSAFTERLIATVTVAPRGILAWAR